MKLIVLIPSLDYVRNAGARIRYLRIVEEFACLGGSLEFVPIDEFEPVETACDALLISKCHDARAIISAIRARQSGIKVGVDLFDDYFSRAEDSRMARYRNWLSQLAPHLSFALCSTARMAAIAQSYRADLLVHVMNDPAIKIDPALLAQVLRDKQQTYADRQALELCWFGMGRNPHFPVGLYDLKAFGGALRKIAGQGVAPRLTVLTNAQALEASELAALQRLPIPVRLEPWSEVREAEVLANSHAAFIPVNAQAFSVAKSQNRAWTALAAGCQVISAGYPLYSPLHSVIYREVDALLGDLHQRKARLRPETVGHLVELQEKYASTANEAAMLFDFLTGVPTSFGRAVAGPLCLIHGAASNATVHNCAQRQGALTVRSPFCPADLEYDILFWSSNLDDPLQVLLSDNARGLAERAGCDLLEPAGQIGGRTVWSFSGSPTVSKAPPSWSTEPIALQIAAYPAIMQEMHGVLDLLFGSVELILAEYSPWPFPLAIKVLT